MTMSTCPASIFCDRLLLLLGGAEAAEHIDLEREGGEALLEGIEVLEGQHRRRRKHGDLAIVADGLESGAHGDFGFAVADIAAEQAVHRRRGFHVVLDVDDGAHLVVGLVELEGIFELALPFGVGGEGVTLGACCAAA